jgi:serpin B
VIALPYKGDLAEMVIILPDLGTFDSLENTLDDVLYGAILQELRPSNFTLCMPRFEFSVDFNLKVVLSGMGMPLAFDYTKADFSNITNSERLFVKQAFHRAYILVNEEGTEAAAATFMIPAPTALSQVLRIDRPFIFIIRDVPTGTILFAGRVVNPLDK